MADPIYPTEGTNGLQVNAVVYDSGGSPPGTARLRSGRRVTWDSEQVGAQAVEPVWVGTATTEGGRVGVGDSSTLILSAKSDRQFAIITNVSTEVIWLRFDTSGALVDYGTYLVPGGSLTIGPNLPYHGAISGIHADTSATHYVGTIEG